MVTLTLKNDLNLTSRVKAMERDGYTYFPQAISPDLVSTLKDKMDGLKPIEDSFNTYTTPKSDKPGGFASRRIKPQDIGFLNKHINNVFNHDPIFIQFLDCPEVIDLAEYLHGKDCHIIGMTAWVTGPGRPDQQLHCDWLPWELPEDILSDPRVKIPFFITTTHYYLNDMSEELGPTKFVPGSHLSGRRPSGATEWKGKAEQSVLCKAGDALTFRSEIWHRGTANKSNEIRYLLQVHYANRMITQKFPPYLNKFQFNKKIISTCSPRQKRLLGDHVSGNYD